MNKFFLGITTIAFFFSCHGLFVEKAYGQTVIDTMVRDNINLRRRAEVYKSRRGGAAAKKNNRTASSNTRNSQARNTTNSRIDSIPLSGKVDFGMDLYNYFAAEDANGFTVDFAFSPVSGTTSFIKKYNYNPSQGLTNAEISGIPAGNYVVTAKANYRGKIHRVLLATKIGSPSDPNGGNFASSVDIQVISSKGEVETSPNNFYIRIVD